MTGVRIMRKNAQSNNALWMAASIWLFVPAAVFAQDLEQDRRIELLESQVAELRKVTTTLTKQIELLRMKVQDRPGTPSNLLSSPGEKPSQSTVTSWVVKISSVTTADTSEIRHKVNNANVDARLLEQRLEQYNEQLNLLNMRRSRIVDSSKAKVLNLNRAIKEKEREIRKTEAKLDHEQSLVRKLTREIQQAKSSRRIGGTTANDEPIVIIAKGPAAMTAKTLKIGGWYLVSGTARRVGDMTHIDMTTATSTRAPQENL